jgi:hypothetical protein
MKDGGVGDQRGIEPTVEELISDPMVLALMRSDGLLVDDVRALLRLVRHQRANGAGRRSAIHRWRGILFAWRERRRTDRRLANLDDALLTTDCNLRAEQVPRLVETYPYGIDEFDHMLVSLGLDTKSAPLKASMRVDLYSTCVGCSQRQRCQQWLDQGTGDGGYRFFCPNAHMFDRLLSVHRWRVGRAPGV